MNCQYKIKNLHKIIDGYLYNQENKNKKDREIKRLFKNLKTSFTIKIIYTLNLKKTHNI